MWRVPEEVPAALVYNGRNYAVMLTTPADLEDFAVGFSLTERVVDDLSEIISVDIYFIDRGIELRIDIASDRIERLDTVLRRRNLAGRASCGLCGLENAETFFEVLPRVSDTLLLIDQHTLLRALRALPRFQALNEETRTVHAAAWVGSSGNIALAREDVGRHNALDKLMGALSRRGVEIESGFLLMSSRCSYEIVEKAARCGVRAIASISAPTAFALRKAREANIALYARDRERFVMFDQSSE